MVENASGTTESNQPTTDLRPEDLLREVQAMPEKIVNAIREATNNTKSEPNNENKNEQGTDTNNATSTTSTRQRTFSEWWFGS